MNAIFFNWHDFEQHVAGKHQIDFPDTTFTAEPFDLETAKAYQIVSIFVGSDIGDDDLEELKKSGCQLILLRSAGYNMVNVELAESMGIDVCRVADYSPESIAEYAIALMLHLARKLNHQRQLHTENRSETTLPAMGFLLRGKKLGLHGYGKIAREVAHIARNGFGMEVSFYDPFVRESMPDTQLDTLAELYATSDIVSIHVPLVDETRNCVNAKLLENITREKFMLINTARGGIVDTEAVIAAMKSGKIDYLGVDVWGDEDLFAPKLLQDNAFQSHHVAFFTEEAVKSILEQTRDSLIGRPKHENEF